jgi:ERCC4-related helicase
MAPTLPLVRQQVKACYEIMGIPVQDTALITGRIKAEQRTSIWKARRLFFCTPQTVQKDLENNRIDASNVVCVVLDEAHKATGKYPYCTVIEYIEQAGAKFRILALSATPGTSIKTIQSVVDTLRISRIEARSDSDPDVKQYIHQRETEVIVVSNSSALDGVRLALSAIIDPLLDELRNAGAFPQSFPSNATVVSYNLLQARESYQKRPDAHGGITAKIMAAHWFVQLRADLHNQGIGIVRNKVAQLKNGIQNKNYLKSFLHKKEFQALWNEIESASWGPESSEQSANHVVEQKLHKNPKLTKLREILTEHFERARACGASSRAIVFSQFRDSGQEIEQVLQLCQPLLRPRHFIGQGRGGSNSSSGDDPTTTSLKGMNQNEQQKATREFSEGVYNVLG